MTQVKTIDPGELAFDIDGVVADTMEVFLSLARERYGFTSLVKEDLLCYDLHACLDIPDQVVDEMICLTLDDDHTLQIPPVEGAVDVLTELSRHVPLRFVTARIWPESIIRWLHQTLSEVPSQRIQVFATGRPEAKANLLRQLGVRTFVDDRVETCWHLVEFGIEPLLFDQPWNRGTEVLPFPRIENWSQLGQRLKF